MNAKLVLVAALVAGLTVVAAAQAQEVYRWVDAQGNVHYSQTPPPGAVTHVKRVNIVPPPINITNARDQQALVNAVAAANAAHQKAADEAAQAAAKRAQQQQACDAARQQLQQYMESHRVITNANSANPTYYTGDDLVKLREQAQAQVNKICGGG
ncbi:MAG: DUF4124 domain-containing protein [Gammaproteobacteria bacterium]